MLYLLCFFSPFPRFLALHFQFSASVAVVLSLLFLKWALDTLPLLRDISQLASGVSRGTEACPRGGGEQDPMEGVVVLLLFSRFPEQEGRLTPPQGSAGRQSALGVGALKLSFQDGVLTRPLQVLVLGLTPGFSGFAWPFRRAGLWKLSCTGFNSSLNASASWIHPLGSHFAA